MGERWEAVEYGSPPETYFIREVAGETIVGGGRKIRRREALLIAAAPDLLAVAKMCAELSEKWGEQGPLSRAAKAAIAKATGEAEKLGGK